MKTNARYFERTPRQKTVGATVPVAAIGVAPMPSVGSRATAQSRLAGSPASPTGRRDADQRTRDARAPRMQLTGFLPAALLLCVLALAPRAAAQGGVPLWTNQPGGTSIAAGFNLQSAPAVTDTFTNISGATSPYTSTLSGPQQFFRLKGDWPV